MATVTLARADVFPEGTVVGVYPPGAGSADRGSPPTAAAIATGTVTGGTVSVTNAGILQGVSYDLGAQVGGVWAYVKARSTLDVSDTGRATGTGTLTSGSNVVTGLAASSGAFAVGQRIRAVSGAALPPRTFIARLPSDVTAKTGLTAVAATGIFTLAGHPYKVGDTVQFSALTGGTGISTTTTYYVVRQNLTASTFSVSTTPGGTVFTFSTNVTVGTVTGVAVLTDNATASGSTALEADGASPAQVPPDKGTLAEAVPVAVSRWQAKVRQRRVLMGTS